MNDLRKAEEENAILNALFYLYREAELNNHVELVHVLQFALHLAHSLIPEHRLTPETKTSRKEFTIRQNLLDQDFPLKEPDQTKVLTFHQKKRPP